MSIDLTDPAGYRFWIEERVRFADLDALGHVNNNTLGVYFEQGRVAFLGEAFASDLPWTVVVARLVTEFKAELLYPATVRVGMRALRLGNTSATLGSAIFHGDRLIATQEAVSVIVDRHTHRPVPVPGEVRSRLAEHMG
ncbi:acyl-CoA thioesterase [Azospirillum halopraeferens]|uniref:acyl-CoA thioesterase n=1 Tax=Azospirillum halopraeferens TaxID=34010 RepID=UPI0004028536|nr:thioesterase family protein [Azospirillum halopraeferens]